MFSGKLLGAAYFVEFIFEDILLESPFGLVRDYLVGTDI